jgi:hypothetical protein
MTQTPTSAAREATQRLKGVWNQNSCSGTARCPAHQDTSPSLTIRPGNKAVLFHCFAGCSQHEILAALRARNIGTNDYQDASFEHAQVRPSNDEAVLARKIWGIAKPIGGTLAEKYLQSRGIFGLRAGRFAPSLVTYEHGERLSLPALVLPFENEREITAIQRIFLSMEGRKSSKLAKAKRNLGTPGDGAIRFGHIEHGILNLAEGPEDALSAMLMMNLPGCWAACGVERYARIEIPGHVHTVRLWTQKGPAAAAGLAKARAHLMGVSRRLEVIDPPAGGDWNDALLVSLHTTHTRGAA